MSRARNLKPGFFKNEALAELHPLARILFAGLWTIADREGRMEDRPKRIKADVLPYDRCDVDGLLQVLHDAEFILRYNDDFNRYIQILTWHKHQKPHIKEAPSTIPAPNKHLPRSVPGQCKVGASTDLGDDEHLTRIPSSLVVGSLDLVVGNGNTHTPADSTDSPQSKNVAEETVKPAFYDEQWSEFRQIATEYGMQCSEIEWQEAGAWEWSSLDPDQRYAAAEGIRQRLLAGDTSLVNMTPRNYLKRRSWERRVIQRAPMKGPQSLAAKLLAEAEELERRGL